ncbi:hypothetical protein SAY87_024868 [Trapa incisa]|uniref:Uncharacterized protein n=1 Tax=Trapa incisa TaxID=236973 RepID=A0AAN7JG38_9MYRT|nr:hypothetical protein SAY87_024868 [Trapa incisa]
MLLCRPYKFSKPTQQEALKEREPETNGHSSFSGTKTTRILSSILSAMASLSAPLALSACLLGPHHLSKPSSSSTLPHSLPALGRIHSREASYVPFKNVGNPSRRLSPVCKLPALNGRVRFGTRFLQMGSDGFFSDRRIPVKSAGADDGSTSAAISQKVSMDYKCFLLPIFSANWTN